MITQIRNESDYNDALKEIEGLMSAKAHSAEGDRLNILVTMVEAYEAEHYPMPMSDDKSTMIFDS